MAFVVKDRVKETCSAPGTGTVTLLGAVTGYAAFSVIGNSNSTYYCIADQAGANWEVGIGTYTSSGTTLSRDTVLESSNSNALVNFSAGTKEVFVTYPAERSVFALGAGVTSDTGSIYINKTTASLNTTLNSGENGISIGPVTVSSGVSINVNSGQRWVII